MLAQAPPGRMILAPIPAAKAHAPAVFTKSRLEISLPFFSTAIVFLLVDIKRLAYFGITLISPKRGGEKTLEQLKPRQNSHLDQVCRMSNVKVDKVLSSTSLLHNRFVFVIRS